MLTDLSIQTVLSQACRAQGHVLQSLKQNFISKLDFPPRLLKSADLIIFGVRFVFSATESAEWAE
jgi:hypothetical protein